MIDHAQVSSQLQFMIDHYRCSTALIVVKQTGTQYFVGGSSKADTVLEPSERVVLIEGTLSVLEVVPLEF